MLCCSPPVVAADGLAAESGCGNWPGAVAFAVAVAAAAGAGSVAPGSVAVLVVVVGTGALVVGTAAEFVAVADEADEAAVAGDAAAAGIVAARNVAVGNMVARGSLVGRRKGESSLEAVVGSIVAVAVGAAVDADIAVADIAAGTEAHDENSRHCPRTDDFSNTNCDQILDHYRCPDSSSYPAPIRYSAFAEAPHLPPTPRLGALREHSHPHLRLHPHPPALGR